MAVVSTDNRSRNGEKIRNSVVNMVEKWLANGFVSRGFAAWVEDEERVSFPWTMIDKITPRPAPAVEKTLVEAGFEDMWVKVTSKNGYTAAFVNAEKPQSLTFIPPCHCGLAALAVDDKGKPFRCSDDPMLAELQSKLFGVVLGDPDSVNGKLDGILSNLVIFGSDLVELGLSEKIEGMVKELLSGPGAVRATLKKYLGN